MNQGSQHSGSTALETEIRNGFRALRFRPAIERQFETESAEERCKMLSRNNIIGLLFYHTFLIADYRVIPDAFHLDLVMHFVVMTPLTLAINCVLIVNPPGWIRESLMLLAIFVLIGTISLVVSASHMPLRDVIQFTIVLVILFATFMQRLRFWYALGTCVVAQAAYSTGAASFDIFSADRLLVSNFLFIGILLFSLVGCYNLEYETRMGYLLRARDRIRNQELEAISLRDPLTGVGNRRSMEIALQRALSEGSSKRQTCTAVLLLDVDHFKAYNDTNGHQEGDLCLKRIAGLITSVLQNREAVYRFGGEEFVVILDDASVDQAFVRAEQIRSAIAEAAMPIALNDRKGVTVSIGLAAGRLSHSLTIESLIGFADSALYSAKGNGRNQVWPHSQPGYGSWSQNHSDYAATG